MIDAQSGIYADLSGQGSVIAARMAIEDFGGTVLGKPVEVIFADHQNKPDAGSAMLHAGTTSIMSMRSSTFRCLRWRLRFRRLPANASGSSCSPLREAPI